MNKKIFELLEAKFQGVRKDGLQNLANSLALTCTTEEEATAIVGKLTAESVANYIKDWRKAADAENSQAAQTREENLRKQYDFKEKGTPAPEPPKDEPGKGGLTAKDVEDIVKQAVQNATKDMQDKVAAMQNADIVKARKGQLEAVFGKDVPESYKKSVMQGFEGRTFENDEAFNAYLEATKTNAASFMQDMADRGLSTPKPILGAPNKEGVSQGVADYIKEKNTPEAGLGGKEV